MTNNIKTIEETVFPENPNIGDGVYATKIVNGEVVIVLISWNGSEWKVSIDPSESAARAAYLGEKK